MVARCIIGSLLAALVALQGSPVCAGALQVSPVGLDLPGGRGAAALTIRNDDQTPMNVQVRVFRWTQVDGVDRLDPTDDVVASPPIAPLAAQSQRIIRVVRTADAAATEQCYRLLVDELPPPPSADVHRVQLLLRHSIPLFFDSAAGGVAKVGWNIKTSDQGVLLTGQNTGGRHIRVSNIKLLDSTGATVTERAGLIGYVLAGATVTWVLPKASGGHGDAVRLHADGDLGPIDVPLQSAP